jgi:hypothetical protein
MGKTRERRHCKSGTSALVGVTGMPSLCGYADPSTGHAARAATDLSRLYDQGYIRKHDRLRWAVELGWAASMELETNLALWWL